MKTLFLFSSFLLLLSSCQVSHYTVEQSSDLQYSDYAQSFAMVSNENLSLKEKLAFKSLKMQLIQKKWIYDDVNPDVLVSATLLERTASFRTFTALSKKEEWTSQKVKSDGGTFMVQLIHPVSYQCIWRGLALDLPSDLKDFQFDRVAYSMLEK